MQELLGGLIGICDEVAFGKIAEPHRARDPNLIESQFSFNSLRDFADNIRSVQNVYLGSLDGSAVEHSLSSVVARFDPELDRSVRQLIQSSIASIDAIGAGGITFRDAITDPTKDQVIAAAEQEIGSLMDLLTGQVLPLFAR